MVNGSKMLMLGPSKQMQTELRFVQMFPSSSPRTMACVFGAGPFSGSLCAPGFPAAWCPPDRKSHLKGDKSRADEHLVRWGGCKVIKSFGTQMWNMLRFFPTPSVQENFRLRMKSDTAILKQVAHGHTAWWPYADMRLHVEVPAFKMCTTQNSRYEQRVQKNGKCLMKMLSSMEHGQIHPHTHTWCVGRPWLFGCVGRLEGKT